MDSEQRRVEVLTLGEQVAAVIRQNLAEGQDWRPQAQRLAKWQLKYGKGLEVRVRHVFRVTPQGARTLHTVPGGWNLPEGSESRLQTRSTGILILYS